MHTQKLVIYTCAFITSASALVISHNVKQDSEEFIRQSANVVEAPWRLVAVPPVTVPPIPQKAVADNSLTQLEAVKLLLRMNGAVESEKPPEVKGNQFIDVTNVVSFMPERKEPRSEVVEGQLAHPEIDD